MPFHGGLDWGTAAHAVCVVVDRAGKVVVRMDVRHDAAGLTDMLARLRKTAPAAELLIAIERLSGLIVDALAKAGRPAPRRRSRPGRSGITEWLWLPSTGGRGCDAVDGAATGKAQPG